MGKMQRSKGRRGQSEAANILRDRDWIVADLSAGITCEDILATDPYGVLWAVEVKNTVSILPAHLKQAKEQANKRKAKWMLMSHLHGTSSWLVQRQGAKPIVWHNEKNFTKGIDTLEIVD